MEKEQKSEEPAKKPKHCAYCEEEIVLGKEIKVYSSLSNWHYCHGTWYWRPHHYCCRWITSFYLCPPCYCHYQQEQRRQEQRTWKLALAIISITFLFILLILLLINLP